jgi:anaerobic magnesium-protoporphyrin IX monomethyl ester cyclase
MKKLRMFLANLGRCRPVWPLVTPPLGIMYLAAYLRTRFDLDIRLVNQRESNCTNEELARQAIEFEADIVGFSSLSAFGHTLAPLTQTVRAGLPKALIVLGGPHITSFGAKALADTAANAAVEGEGELAFEQVIRAYFDGGDLGHIPGLSWRNGDGEVLTNPGTIPPIEDLDSLPFPAYDLIDLPQYWRRQSMPPVPRRRYVSLLSSRGCPYHCNWCHRIFGKKFRTHSAERITEEIQYFQRIYGVDDFEFLDDIFNLDHSRLLAFCDLLHRRNLRIKMAFPSAVRPDILTQEDVDALADAGTYFSSFALDSGSPRIQKLVGKNLNIPRFVQGVEMAVKRGIFANGFAMLGFPTETEEEMRQTIDVTCHSMLHTASFLTVTPFPNTELYDHVANTHAQQLAKLSFKDTDLCGIRVNLSDVPDTVLFACQRRANQQFFLNSKRIYRILRDHPQRHRLPLYIPIYLARATKGLLGPDKT